MFFPAVMAAFVILDNAVIPITCMAENLAFTASTPEARPDIFVFLAALSRFSSPLEAPERLSFAFNLSSVDILCATFDSKFLLSNRISTTLLSIVLLIS